MFIDSAGTRRVLQAGDSICWHSENGYVFFKQANETVLKDEGRPSSKIDAHFIRERGDFMAVAELVALACGLKPKIVWGEQSPTVQFLA